MMFTLQFMLNSNICGIDVKVGSKESNFLFASAWERKWLKADSDCNDSAATND